MAYQPLITRLYWMSTDLHERLLCQFEVAFEIDSIRRHREHSLLVFVQVRAFEAGH